VGEAAPLQLDARASDAELVRQPHGRHAVGDDGGQRERSRPNRTARGRADGVRVAAATSIAAENGAVARDERDDRTPTTAS
jgi:hypothetical protein